MRYNQFLINEINEIIDGNLLIIIIFSATSNNDSTLLSSWGRPRFDVLEASVSIWAVGICFFVRKLTLLQALIDDCSWQWNRSMMLLAMGWYDVVLIRLDSNSSISRCQSAHSNWRPRSVVTEDGTPNRNWWIYEQQCQQLCQVWVLLLAILWICQWMLS